MKKNCVVLFLGLIIIMVLSTDAMPQSLNGGGQCCFKFFTGKIPPQTVRKVEEIDARCPQQGFIVMTSKHSGLCVHQDPRKRN